MKKCLTWMTTLLMLLGLTACGSDPMEAPELLEPVGVKTDTEAVQRGDLYDIAAYNAEIVPYVEEVHFLVNGSLDELRVSVGDYVREGEVLAVLEEEQLLDQIEALEEEIADIRKEGEYSDRITGADIQIAKEELAILQESGASTEALRVKEVEITQLETGLSQAKEMRDLSLQEKNRTLQALKEQSGKNQITAPFSGKVVYISQTRIGSYITGYDPVIYLADESKLSLSSEYISKLDIRDADRIYAVIDDKEYEITYDEEENTHVTYVMNSSGDLEASSDTRTVFQITGTEGEIKSGQLGRVVTISSYRENVLTVPVNALYQEKAEYYVYKQVDDQRVRCDVTVGVITDTKAEIMEGLQEGDRVYVRN